MSVFGLLEGRNNVENTSAQSPFNNATSFKEVKLGDK